MALGWTWPITHMYAFQSTGSSQQGSLGPLDTEINFNKRDTEEERLKQMANEVASSCPVGKALGYEGPGEGIVWIPPGERNSRYRFKIKSEYHALLDQEALKRSQAKQQKGGKKNKKEAVAALAAGLAGENRLNQGLAYLHEMNQPVTKQSMGTFLQWVATDVEKEEGDLLDECEIEEKDVRKALTNHARLWFLTKI